MTTQIDTAVRSFYAAHGVQDETILVGVSGGIDSSVLLHALIHSGRDRGVNVCIAHVNHCLRAEHSDSDEHFVRNLANTYNCDILVERFATRDHHLAAERGIEACARMQRYSAFARWAAQTNARFVCTAHTMNDNVETFIMHAARGSGYKGLSAIPALRADAPYSIARPLLDCPRSEVELYAAEHGLSWREDHTNDSDEYTRNRVRHTVLPALTSALGASALNGIHETTRHMKQLRRGLDVLLAPYRDAIKRSSCNDAERVVLDADALNELHPDLRALLLHDTLSLSSIDQDRIQVLLTQEPGTRASLSNNVMALKERGYVIVGADGTHDAASIRIDGGGRYLSGDDVLDLDTLTYDKGLVFSPNVTLFDADHVLMPLYWRTWTDGDRVAPFGMDGKSALVSDILTNLRVPHEIRRNVRVLTNGSSILWVCGFRRSNIAPVTNATTRVLRCTFSTHETSIADR